MEEWLVIKPKIKAGNETKWEEAPTENNDANHP